MIEPQWKSQFPEVYEEILEAYKTSGFLGSFTAFAFKKNALSSREYLRWAQQFYQIAVLQDHYFAKHLKLDLFEKTKGDIKWTTECVPVAEWEGSIFVAVLDPDSLPKSDKYSLKPLLASYEMLTQCWLKLNGSENASYYFGERASQEPPKPAPPAEPTQNLNLEAQVESDEQSDSNPEESHSEETEAPEGLSFNQPTAAGANGNSKATPNETLSKFDFSSLSKSGTFSPNQGAAAPAQYSAPASKPKPENNGLPKLKIPNLENEVKAKGEEFPQEEEITQKIKKPVPSHSPALPSFSAKAKDMLSAIQDSSNTLSGISPRPVNKSWAAHPMDLIKSDSELESLAADLFAKSYKHYSKAMIFKVEKDTAIPIMWDQSFKPLNINHTWKLTTPSIFRIVSKSQKPFHGPISMNAVNKSFIDVWFEGKSPSHLSIFPIIFGDDTQGLFLAASNSEIDYKESLKSLGKIANHLRDSVKERLQDPAAA